MTDEENYPDDGEMPQAGDSVQMVLHGMPMIDELPVEVVIPENVDIPSFLAGVQEGIVGVVSAFRGEQVRVLAETPLVQVDEDEK
jgi:hypothetical protein